MQTKSYEFLLEAVTPIAHHQEVFGNHAVVMRRKVRQPDGSWANVPILTGDTMRHGLREAAAYAFLDAAGILDAGNLTESALRLLFSGGMVTGKGGANGINLDTYREMVDVIPPLGLLGGCASNRVIPGRLVSEDAVLLCEESRHIASPWMVARAGTLSGARAHLEVAQRVRMDATLDPGKTKLLSEGERARVEGRLLASESAHTADDAVEARESKSTMMPRTYECIAAGSLLAWRVVATCLSELDVDTFHAMVGAFLHSARVGGKRGTGHGLLRAVAANETPVLRHADRMQSVDLSSARTGDLFRAHVKERAERAKTFLQSVDA